MPAYRHGRHEHGQNFLDDRRIVSSIISLVAATNGPIIEIGPGGGALTLPLARLGRPVTAVEIDPALADNLRTKVDPAIATIVTGDFLRHRLHPTPHVIVGNLPFHLTTAILRHLLISKAGLSSDWSLQLDSMKLESLVIANQPCCGEYVPGPCTHRPSSHGSWGYLKLVTVTGAT